MSGRKLLDPNTYVPIFMFILSANYKIVKLFVKQDGLIYRLGPPKIHKTTFNSQRNCAFSVGIMIRVPAEQPGCGNRFCASPKRPDWFYGPPSPLYNWVTKGSFRGSKAAAPWSWPLTPILRRGSEWVEPYHHFPIPLHGVQREHFTILQPRGETKNTVNYSPISVDCLRHTFISVDRPDNRAWALQLYRIESLHPLGHSATAVSHRKLASAGTFRYSCIA